MATGIGYQPLLGSESPATPKRTHSLPMKTTIGPSASPDTSTVPSSTPVELPRGETEPREEADTPPPLPLKKKHRSPTTPIHPDTPSTPDSTPPPPLPPRRKPTSYAPPLPPRPETLGRNRPNPASLHPIPLRQEDATITATTIGTSDLQNETNILIKHLVENGLNPTYLEGLKEKFLIQPNEGCHLEIKRCKKSGKITRIQSVKDNLFQNKDGKWNNHHGSALRIGQKHGPGYRLSADVLTEEFTYHNGNLEGKHIVYLHDGTGKIESTYHKGKLNGPQVHYNEKGIKTHKYEYEKGERVEQTLYHPNGQVSNVTPMLYNDVHGYEKIYSQEGVYLGRVYWSYGKQKNFEQAEGIQFEPDTEMESTLTRSRTVNHYHTALELQQQHDT